MGLIENQKGYGTTSNCETSQNITPYQECAYSIAEGQNINTCYELAGDMSNQLQEYNG